MTQYLYAAFSVKPLYEAGVRQGAPGSNNLLGVAMQEVQHLGKVNQLLVALGATPTLIREDFPYEPDIYPFPFDLEPLSTASLAKYVWTEAPVGATQLAEAKTDADRAFCITLEHWVILILLSSGYSQGSTEYIALATHAHDACVKQSSLSEEMRNESSDLSDGERPHEPCVLMVSRFRQIPESSFNSINRRYEVAIFPVDSNRFDPTASATESAERQRVTVARQIIPNSRPTQPDNGDFAHHLDGRANFTKGLKHDPITGRVDSAAYAAFTAALGQPRETVLKEIDKLTPHVGAGTTPPRSTRKWVNPVAGRAFSVVGGDPQQYAMPAPPKFGSDELSFEIVENYWMALLRDVPFSQYESNALAIQAAAEVTAFRNAAIAERAAACPPLPDEPLAPVDSMTGNITPRPLFRGLSVGDDKGPYISQFLIHPVPFGAQGFHQRNKTLKAGQDFMTHWPEWVAVQNGAPRDFIPSHFDDTLHYLRNGRDLSQWVHIDVLFQGYFNACLLMLQGAGTPSAVSGGIGAARSVTNPYQTAKHQQGFGTLGDPAHIGMMCEVAALALKAVWFQKWFVHLRLRPEVYAGRIDYERRVPGLFALPASLMGSQAVASTVAKYGTALLPMAFPEGSPMHPAYGAGHATVAGACVTILKALFKGDEEFPNPVDVFADYDGNEHLVPYGGPDTMTGNDLTIEGELNKLASNIAIGRNIAGVHWRSDGTYSLRLGEDVAMTLLEVYAKSYAEFSPGETVFRFNKFDGTPCAIVA